MKKIAQIFCLLLIVFCLNTGISTSVFSDYEALDGDRVAVALLPAELDFYLASDQKSVGFKAENIGNFVKLNYTVSYNCFAGERQIAGEINLNGETNVAREGLVLGTCSGENCVYDEGIDKIKLNIELTRQDGMTEAFEREITL
jgi:hypothetical protein